MIEIHTQKKVLNLSVYNISSYLFCNYVESFFTILS